MRRAEALAWLARRLAWEERLDDLETRDGESTMQVATRTRRIGRDLDRVPHRHTPVARAS
jgi:hypothetical protein